MNKTEQNLTDFTHRQRLLIDVIVFLLIVTVGIASRFWLADVPNFKPVAALVLFGGFFFRKAWPAIAALLLVMMVSDLKLGAYNWELAACVYASLGIACGLGVWIKRSVDTRGGRKLGWKQVGRFAGASLVMSTTFYLATNGAFWWTAQCYPASWAGLVDCYVAGIPFFRATLLGDLCFTGLLVGGCALFEAVLLRPVVSSAVQLIPLDCER
jgi:hypothetical protein